MRIDEIEARLAEIRSSMSQPDYDDARSESLLAEVRGLTEEREQLRAAAAHTEELRRAVGAGTIQRIQTQEAEHNNPVPTLEEIRSSDAYAVAYVRSILQNNQAEVRALLTTGVSGGQIPVPTNLETQIRTAWEENNILSLVNHSYFRGDVKIGFELSATGASIHVEGAAAPAEETITLGVVTLTAQSIKKWIRVSTEAMENTTVETANYIFREMAHRIVEKAVEVLIGTIVAAPATATATAAGVPVLTADTVAASTVVQAVSLLAGSARDLHLLMNRQTYPTFIAVAMAANYAIDVFDGLKDRIEYTDALPALSAADAGDTYLIVGDFARGAQVNFPNGDTITMIVDPYTEAEKDLVKIVGRQSVGMGVVADRHFVKVAKAAQVSEST